MSNELREPVIKIMAKTCGDQISKKRIQTWYKFRPDYADIMEISLKRTMNLHEKEKCHRKACTYTIKSNA